MGWRQLLSIYREAEDTFAAEQSQPPTACPNHGDPLETNSRGVLHCPLGDFTWPEGAR